MPSVNEDPGSIDRFRRALPRFLDKQTAALHLIDREMQLTEAALAEAAEAAQREVDDRNRALQACIAAAIAYGGYGGCGAEAAALEAAEERLRKILDAQRQVADASGIFLQAERRHLEYLSTALPTMEAGLTARVESLEKYLSWRLSAGRVLSAPSATNATRLLADDLASKRRYGSIRQPSPIEARESPGGSPERGG